MKKLKKVALVLIALGLAYTLFVCYSISKETKAVPTLEAQTLIILGAKVNGDPANPSPVLKERLNTGLSYLVNHPNTKVVVTGGKGEDESDSEANVMATFLIEHGISAERIIREDESTRTMENLMNAKTKTDLGHTVIVSNDYHMYRAKMLAERIGIKDVEGLAAPSETSAKTKNYLREVLALGYGMIFDW